MYNLESHAFNQQQVLSHCQQHHSTNHHLGEEGVVAANELQVQGSTSTPLKHGAHLLPGN
jgi:hypothetical protein